MQQEQSPVCNKCGYQNPGNYCPNCGAQQHGQRNASNRFRLPWKLTSKIAAAAAGMVVVALAVTAVVNLASGEPGTSNARASNTGAGNPWPSNPRSGFGSPFAAPPTATPRPTATPIPPVHQLVTCREIADHWTLENESIRKITKLSVNFRGQDRFECEGYADVEWAEDQWITLGAKRDFQGTIYYFIE